MPVCWLFTSTDLYVLFETNHDGEVFISKSVGPWNRAACVRVDDAENLVDILRWCKAEFHADDWRFQYRNQFATNEVIFYFNNLRDYTIFVLKYQR